MELVNTAAPAMNRFASQYIENMESVQNFFHYNINDKDVFLKRYEDLMKREFNRDQLADCINSYLKKFPSSERTELSLAKLRNEQSAVVIGGQQAGLLMGPLYTVHKIISIIKLAEEQEKALGKPVVPIFWIAGEDHDYLEINHIFVKQNGLIRKWNYPEFHHEKKMASDITFDKSTMKAWVKQIFSCFGEKLYTKELLSLLDDCISESKTFTDFFSQIVMQLFKDYGLLLIDSSDPGLRKLEKPFFRQLIRDRKKITDSVLSQQEQLKKVGFDGSIELDPYAANLFYYDGEERELLEYSPAENMFVSKTNELQFSEKELVQLLDRYPERFSNNVVTRPLMQEWLFPTLAFIAGPGEIAYWGELRKAFEAVGNQMPPIVPRLNITFLDASVERDLFELELPIDHVLAHGIEEEKNGFLDSIKDGPLIDIMEETKTLLTHQYEKITGRIEELDKGHVKLARTNLSLQLKQLDFLYKKVEESIERKHGATLEKFKRAEQMLVPEGILQERIWNIFYFLNDYGLDLIKDLLSLSYTFDGKHKIIKI